jgi:hypothetical protein
MNVTLAPGSGALLLGKPVTARSGEPAPPPLLLEPPPLLPLLEPLPLLLEPPPLLAGGAGTAAEAPVLAEVEPPAFVAVTTQRIVVPATALVTSYRLEVAPEMVVQVVDVQDCH